jgi:hypothetical protein
MCARFGKEQRSRPGSRMAEIRNHTTKLCNCPSLTPTIHPYELLGLLDGDQHPYFIVGKIDVCSTTSIASSTSTIGTINATSIASTVSATSTTGTIGIISTTIITNATSAWVVVQSSQRPQK